VTTLQIMQLRNGAMAKGSGNTPLAHDVSLAPTDYPNGAHHRMPWAVSRDLQAAAITGKELYFKVTDPLLKDVAHSGMVKTGLDFLFTDVGGAAIPYVIQSYDGAAGTLMGVFKPASLAGSTAFTRGYLYFSNAGWTTSKEDSVNTFPSATSVLFLPSKTDHSSAGLNFNRDLPTSDKVIVNPGALCDGDIAGNDYMTRNLTGDCGDFLISFLAESTENNSDNSPISFGASTGGGTVIFIRHLYEDAASNTDPAHYKNAWRTGFANSEGSSFYETASNIADNSLQHVVMRRVSGQSLQLYVNGVLIPWAFKQEPGGTPQSARISFASQVLYIGRGAVASSRFWKGYLDCFKFFKDDAKTTGWALAEYNNLSDVDGAVIFGSPETFGTASVWGEAIKITADERASVDFKADKYSATLAGTISLDSVKPFDNPVNGTFADRGSNNVRYTNVTAVDPDNAGKVHLTNSTASVVIPVRAHVNISAPPPATGYYSRPNIGGKDFKPVSNRAELIQALDDVKAGRWSTTDFYIKAIGDISGNPITHSAGGNVNHPLVIMSDDGGNPDSWPASRPTVSTRFILTGDYIWLYALDLSYPGSTESAPGISPQGNWQFVTACRLTGKMVWFADATSVLVNNLHFNYNACYVRVPVGWGPSIFLQTRCSFSGATATNTAHPLMIARNYFTDASDNSTGGEDRVDVIYGSPGKADHRGSFHDVRVEYNFLNCRMKRGIYIKFGIVIKWNHVVPNGGASSAVAFRGETPINGIAAYNRIDGSQQLMVNGTGHLILSNIVGGGANIPLSTLQSGAGEKSTMAADGCRVIGNTGKVLVPGWTVNADDPAGKLGNFDPGVYQGLPAGKNIVLAGPNQAYHEDDERTGHEGDAADVIPVTNNHPQQTQVGNTNGYRWRNSSEIWIYDAIDSAWGYTLETPPTLNTTVCGPKAKGSGKLWGS
jgi:hypothetical protein